MKKLQIFYVFMILTILNYESLYAYAKSVGFYLEIRGGNGLSYSGSEYNNIKNLNKNLTFPDIINQYNVLNYGSLEQKIQYFYFYSNVKKPELNTKTLDLSLGNLGGLKLEWNRENQTITGLRDNFLSEWIMINSFLYDGQYSSDINSIFQKNYPYILLSVLDTSKTIKEQINSLNLYFYIFSGKVFRSFYLYPRLGIGIGSATSLESGVFRLTLGSSFIASFKGRQILDIGIDFVHNYFFRTRTALNEANFSIGIGFLVFSF